GTGAAAAAGAAGAASTPSSQPAGQPAAFGQCKARPVAKAGGARPIAKAKARGTRPMSKTKRVASRGTGSKATKRRPATRLAAATPRSAPPSGAVTRPQTWCDEASARTQ
ncbi:hypothetical protein J7J66_19360, partial [Lysobacter sp. ISL-54]|nr:hypothetical protein [Lysobacter sp. ISL-54]